MPLLIESMLPERAQITVSLIFFFAVIAFKGM